ncbi:alpha-glucan family phosphorylase, partial [Candidatus Woesearchaeota archaeon CG08_land_8_20_14_0_20_43_7]
TEKQDRFISYFTMEIGLDSRMPTYSGGLGILAGDTIKSCADLKVPIIVITLLNEKGYFYQKLDENGNQSESPFRWTPESFMTLQEQEIIVKVEGRDVKVKAWEYIVKGCTGYDVPVYFLDTNVEGNSDSDKGLTSHLYGGDLRYRLCQKLVLGVGGVRMIEALGYKSIRKYHMNEGHSSLLTLELLQNTKKENETEFDKRYDINSVRKRCVFTTHTPVPAGHDQFPIDMVKSVITTELPIESDHFCHDGKLNMTLIGLNFSGYVNGVAKKHGEVSRSMFPNYPIDAITNGVHSATWVSEPFKKLYDNHMPGWTSDPFTLRYALSIPKYQMWLAHEETKKTLMDYINKHTNAGFDYHIFTIGFARRATAYKRPDLLFSDIEKLKQIAKDEGRIQIVYAGKAHPKDDNGKDLIRKIFQLRNSLGDRIKIVYLQNYDMEMGKMLTSGVDVWLNTPMRPREASGTSGMKAAHNGVPHFSVLDGWWLEGHVEDVTGWAIGPKPKGVATECEDGKDAEDLYKKLVQIIKMYYYDPENWRRIMRHVIAFNASFFNTHRMVQQYVLNAYLT